MMYKALFELSADRADFLSRLFSRERPGDLGSKTSIEEFIAKYSNARPSERLRDSTARAIREQLLGVHKLPLEADDLRWIEYAFNAFYADGPAIQYARSRPASEPGPSYGALMAATDVWGEPRSYLASENGFSFLKRLQERNLIVPVVGDFAGPKAIRLAGEYIRSHGGSVQAFYASNVEVYLDRQQSAAFCGNLSSLPYSSASWFVGSKALRPLAAKVKSCLNPSSRAADASTR